jgi:hypothetical protein
MRLSLSLSLSLLRGVSRNTGIRSSMKLSVRAVTVVGMPTASGMARAIGTSSGSKIGVGVSGWAGLRSFAWSQSSQRRISFDRSVTNSEKAHQVGGFGEPPKVSRSAA